MAAAAMTLGLLASGCGGGSGTPQVANIDSTSTSTSTTSTSTTSSGGKFSSGPSLGHGGQFRIAMNVGSAADGRKFSACMRQHGVANFPDPDSQGLIQLHSGMGIDPGSPAFASARDACQTLLPNGGQPSPQQQAQMKAQLLKFSQCMRAHGIKDFPDPSDNGLQIRVHPGSDIDPDNPTFQAAQQACQSYAPGKLGAKVGAAGAGNASTGGGK